MEKAVWTAAFVAVAATGIAIVAARRSRTWIAIGILLALGGLGIAFYSAFLPDPPVGKSADIAVWADVLGFFCLVGAGALTLIAIGSQGRRRFLVVLAATTLAVGTYQFWTSNWAARFGDVQTQCLNTGHAGLPGSVQRVPPGVHCYEDIALAGPKTVPRKVDFVPADAISWLALLGFSAYYACALTFTLMGAGWLLRRRSALTRRFGMVG